LILLTLAGCLVLLSVLFFVSFAEAVPGGISALERVQCDEVIRLTEKQVELLYLETANLANQPDIETRTSELEAVVAKLNDTQQALKDLQAALERDDRSAMLDALTRLKSK